MAARKPLGRGLNARQAGYVLGLLKGKSKRRAALEAGYSQWVADSAAQDVEGKRRGRFSMIRQFVEVLNGEAANQP
jgi:phage terminase small subunit